MSELTKSTQAHIDSGQNRRNTAVYLAIVAAAIVALSCIAVCTAVAFVLIDKVPWHHLWEHLLQTALALSPGA